MNVQLDENELAELRELLGHALRDLSGEITDTDNAEFRRSLRSRRELLESVAHKLETAG